MPKHAILLVGASLVAIGFPSAFDKYRERLASESASETLDQTAGVVEASMPIAAKAGPRSATLLAGPDGHFRASARFDGRAVDVLVDTGATYVAMNEATARRLGVYVSPGDFRHRTQTANGEAAVAISRFDRVAIGAVEVRDVEVAVTKGTGLPGVLLGMSFLKKLSRYDVSGGKLNLVR